MIAVLLVVILFLVSLSLSAGIAYLFLRSAIWYTTRRS